MSKPSAQQALFSLRPLSQSIVLSLTILVGVGAAFAVPPTLELKPIDANEPSTQPAKPKLLGEPYENKLASISFRPPAGMELSPNPQADSVAEFTEKENEWELKVTRAIFQEPVPLTTEIIEKGKDRITKTGLLDYTVDELMAQNPSAKSPLRKDIINVDNYQVGMFALCYTRDLKRVLRQQAIVQANDQLYYLLIMTSPAGSVEPGEGGEKQKVDAKIQQAVRSFVASVDSVKLLDRTALVADQKARALRGRTMMMLWKNPKKFDAIRIEKQYLRFVQNGKDIGYTYIEELNNETRASKLNGDGYMIYERTRIFGNDANGAKQVSDLEAFHAATFDLKHERWMRNIVIKSLAGDPDIKPLAIGDFGESSEDIKLKLDPVNGVIQPNDDPINAPKMRPVTSKKLTTTIVSRNSNPETVTKELPVFYIPQATRHLLPRMIIDHTASDPRTYLFGVYMPETKDVRTLYIDVSPERRIAFNGQDYDAIVVSERVGLGGALTMHYLTAEGKYIGSEKPSARYQVIPTDEATLMKIWPEATLTRPEPIKPGSTPK